MYVKQKRSEMEAKPETFGEWCLLELMGHRKIAGFVREVTLAGAGLLRIDVYAGDAEKAEVTQFMPPSVLYCMTPISEELARRFAQAHTVTPISRYELPAPPPARATVDEDLDEDAELRADEEADYDRSGRWKE
jgi:hypothetical protein